MQAHKAAAHVGKWRFALCRATYAGGTFFAQARKARFRVRGHVAGAKFALIKELAVVPRLAAG